jgi:hypothetical protein
MRISRHAHNLFNCLLLAVSVALVACGGGGGSGSGGGAGADNPPSVPPPVNRGFTASVASIDRAASVAGDEPFDATIQVTITDTALDQFGFRATYTSNGIAYATRTDLSPTSIEIFIGFSAPPNIAPGTYRDIVRLGFCADAGCTAFKETILDIPVSYTVTIGTLPAVSLATSTVNLSQLPWEVRTPADARVAVTVTPHTRYFLAVTTSQTSDGVASVTYTQDVNDVGNIVIGFKPPTQLSPGVHTDTINVVACIEQDCKYPLTVTPSVITVTYDVTTTIPGPQGFSVDLSAQPVADVVWSESRHRLYAAIPAQSANYPGSVVEFDPETEMVSNPVAAGFDPSLLALSDDESTLYASQRGGDSIRRFTTAPLTPDILISLGNDSYPPGTEPLFAADMRVAPGQPHLLAVRRNVNLPGRNGAGIVLFDDAVQRPDVAQISVFSDWGNVAWDPSGALIYTNQAVLSVSSNGLSYVSQLQSSQGRLRYFNGMIYSDDAHIVDPAAPLSYVWYPTLGQSRAASIDIPKNRAYYATQYLGGETAGYIEVFNLATRELVGRALLPGFAAGVTPTRLVRFGTDGLALVNSANELYLVRGALIQ